MDELAPHPVRAVAILPKAVALLLPKGLGGGGADQLFGSVGKSALKSVGASAEFREILAELSFVFGGICLEDEGFVVSFIIAVALGGDARGKVKGFLVDFSHDDF